MQLDNHPVALVLSRQNIPTFDRTNLGAASGVAKGGYILSDCEGEPSVILIGTGTELYLCMNAQKTLQAEGIATRVVSMPCQELFDDQLPDYRESVLPEKCGIRIACEAGIRQGWDKYIGAGGHFVGMSGFGASGPAPKLYSHFKITADQIVSYAQVAVRGLDG